MARYTMQKTEKSSARIAVEAQRLCVPDGIRIFAA